MGRSIFAVAAVFAVLCLFQVSANPLSHKSKRSIANFGVMIHCTTDMWPLDFNNYGCYCGFGGKGKPLDAIDSCCKVHDECYTRATAVGCTGFEGPYTNHYPFGCEESKVTCTADSNEDMCEALICDCDKKAADCFAANLSSYTKQHLSVDTEKECHN